jgi:PAS domain S-box-containing protein
MVMILIESMQNSTINLQTLATIFDSVKYGSTITDKNSRIIYTNPSFTTITRYTQEEAIGKNPGMLHSGNHGKDFYMEMWAKISS